MKNANFKVQILKSLKETSPKEFKILQLHFWSIILQFEFIGVLVSFLGEIPSEVAE